METEVAEGDVLEEVKEGHEISPQPSVLKSDRVSPLEKACLPCTSTVQGLPLDIGIKGDLYQRELPVPHSQDAIGHGCSFLAVSDEKNGLSLFVT